MLAVILNQHLIKRRKQEEYKTAHSSPPDYETKNIVSSSDGVSCAEKDEECDFATVYYNKIEAIFVQELKNLYGIGNSSEVEGLSKKEKEDRIEFARAMMDIEM